ncbi:MAG: hypothetical protein Q9227_001401 [Pyrenula ochraceoflavens]
MDLSQSQEEDFFKCIERREMHVAAITPLEANRNGSEQTISLASHEVNRASLPALPTEILVMIFELLEEYEERYYSASISEATTKSEPRSFQSLMDQMSLAYTCKPTLRVATEIKSLEKCSTENPASSFRPRLLKFCNGCGIYCMVQGSHSQEANWLSTPRGHGLPDVCLTCPGYFMPHRLDDRIRRSKFGKFGVRDNQVHDECKEVAMKWLGADLQGF